MIKWIFKRYETVLCDCNSSSKIINKNWLNEHKKYSAIQRIQFIRFSDSWNNLCNSLIDQYIVIYKVDLYVRMIYFYIVPPNIFQFLDELEGWFFSMLFIYTISPTQKNWLKITASSRKSTFEDFFWPKFCRNLNFAIMNAFFHLETWNFVEVCIFMWGIKKVKLTIGLKLLFTP